MVSIAKNFGLILILIMVLSSLSIFVSIPLVLAQSGTNVSGIITQDTAWSPANSPYNLVGNVTVAKGVTLTVESGVQINFIQIVQSTDQYGKSYQSQITYNLQIDGTLLSNATSFYALSSLPAGSAPYNPTIYITFSQTSSNSIIENSYFSGSFQVSIVNSSPQFQQDDFTWGSTIFTSNDGSPIIYGNQFSDFDSYADFEPYASSVITLNGGSAVISDNTIANNTIASAFVSLTDTSDAVISDNQISGNFAEAALSIDSGNAIVERNFVSNPNTMIVGYPAIGILIIGAANPTIENNTITENKIGLNIYNSNGSPSPTIINNNFEQNSQYNIYLGQEGVYGSTAGNINAAKNWWGTTDTSVISQTIYDYKNYSNLGNVTYTPILTSPNPDATPNPNASITTNVSPSPTPPIPEFPSFPILSILIAISTIAFFTIAIRKRHGSIPTKS